MELLFIDQAAAFFYTEGKISIHQREILYYLLIIDNINSLCNMEGICRWCRGEAIVIYYRENRVTSMDNQA